MRRRAALLTAAVAVAIPLLPGAESATGQTVDRVSVPGTVGTPPGLSILLFSPVEFAATRRDPQSGQWVGPRYVLAADPSVTDTATIDWTLAFDNVSRSAEAAAFAAPIRGFPEDQRGHISVPHVVGRTNVGVMPGVYVLKVASNTEENARAEAAVAFPIAQGIFAVARFEIMRPPSDAYRINGVVPTSYNRGQAFVALNGVRLDGNLPPALVTARVSRAPRALRGKVIDAFRHPLVAGTVALERRVGSSWRKAATSRTNRNGLYAFRRPARGRYRAVATLGATRTPSASVRVR